MAVASRSGGRSPGEQLVDDLEQLVRPSRLTEGVGRFERVDEAELGPLGADPLDVAGGDGLLCRRKRGFVIPLGEAECGDSRLVAALHLHLVRASEPLEACEQRARLFEPAAVEKDLDYAVHHAAELLDVGLRCSSGISSIRASASSQRPSMASA